MANTIRKRVRKYSDNINTDIISPPQYLELSVAEAAKYAMRAIDSEFAAKVQAGDLVVAGEIGSGSSRETSPLTLKHLGIAVIIAKFVARIVYRNAINLGIPVIECAQTDKIHKNDILEVDFETGTITNGMTRNECYACCKILRHILALIHKGGLVPFLNEQAAV